MTRKDVAQEVSYLIHAANPGLNIPNTEIIEVIKATTMVIREAVADGKTVTFRGFGAFSPVRRKPKQARHIKNGTAILVPARDVPVFTPSEEFKAQVMTGSSSAEVSK